MFKDTGFHQLGFYVLSLWFVSLALGCLLASPVITRTSLKFCILAGSLGDSFWIAAQIIPTYKSVYKKTSTDSFIYSDAFIYMSIAIASVISGAGSALLWVA